MPSLSSAASWCARVRVGVRVRVRAASWCAPMSRITYPYPNPNPNPNPYRQQAEVPRVVKAISRQLKEKSVKTRVAAFNCTRQLVEP